MRRMNTKFIKWMHIKKWFGLMLALSLALGSILSFGYAQAQLSGTLVIAGSTSLQPVAEKLAEAFMDENPDVDIEVSGGGTGYGIEKCASGEIDIAMASRELTSDDPELIDHEVCRDALVIIVNPKNPATPLDLTTEQVAAIFAKEITNWSELGGTDADIIVVSREEGSGTRKFFEEEIGDISADILCESNLLFASAT
jgi:phosphate transport system substrate-binding protein